MFSKFRISRFLMPAAGRHSVKAHARR